MRYARGIGLRKETPSSKKQPELKINYLGAKKRYQNQGVGRKVVLDLIDMCQEQKINKIAIDAYAECLELLHKKPTTGAYIVTALKGRYALFFSKRRCYDKSTKLVNK
ncbi:MAG: GNAT family N-acetyltransferase [Sulfurimonas sp.]|uniref:GNAT family N-acetyltransferase n=1 Tax=Sulfurimonas sp. TaxID=2022749 RepID=UPI002617E25A|nr:GNAT family N-acetyltransferase [Sulfurimonas sp.]MDD3477221.1 GNAT family N-acetyltransferase [Sulfurimonas sp.]